MTIATIYIPLFVCIATFIALCVTALGWHFGFRDRYIQMLTVLFEFGRERISERRSAADLYHASDDDDDSEDGQSDRQSFSRPKDQERQKSAIGSNRSSILYEFNEKDEDDFNDGERTPEGCSTHEHARDGSRKNFEDEGNIKPPIFLLSDTDVDRDQHEFNIYDAVQFVEKGIAAIVDDQVTRCFDTAELSSWNLLTRNNDKNYQFVSMRLGLSWALGCLVRYSVLMPARVVLTTASVIWLVICTASVGLLPEKFRARAYHNMSIMCFRMMSCGLTAVLKFYNPENRAKRGDICVANHTSPIDVVMLACDNCYALVGQTHPGLLGVLERALSRGASHIWFDRSEMRDRQFVVRKLKEHVKDKTKPPILVFPEGTCINNSAVMMFKKGSFEASDRVYPVAMRYDSRFGDPFWNSSRQGWVQYLLLIMTSWAIKCDVWYMPPMERLEGESAVDFANRVKAEIARKAGLVDLAWDGQLKRTRAKVCWKQKQQEDFVRRLKVE